MRLLLVLGLLQVLLLLHDGSRLLRHLPGPLDPDPLSERRDRPARPAAGANGINSPAVSPDGERE